MLPRLAPRRPFRPIRAALDASYGQMRRESRKATWQSGSVALTRPGLTSLVSPHRQWPGNYCNEHACPNLNNLG